MMLRYIAERCPRCHVHIQHVVGRPCKGMTAAREKMMVAALSEEQLRHYYLNRWTSAHRFATEGTLFPSTLMGKFTHYARTQNISWACRRGMLAGLPGPVQITPEGEQVAISILLRNGLCPQCERHGLQRCEDEGELLGLGCLGCGGMFDARVVARHWMEQQS